MSDELHELSSACDGAAVGCFGAPLRVGGDAPAQARVLAGLLHARRWAAGLETDPGELDPQLVSAPRGPELVMLLAEAAALRLDAPALGRLRRASDIAVEPGRDATWLALARSFLALAAGVPVQPVTLVDLERAGREHHEAGQVLRAATLRALAADAQGHAEEAVDHARRAFRMARTERRPQAEYWAGWTLARLRRTTGRPYLASRILGALRRIAPRPWNLWIDLQRTFSSGNPEAIEGTLGVALGCARRGDAAGFARAVETLRGPLGAFAPLRADLMDLLGCLGVDETSARPVVDGWRGGEPPFAPPPRGFAALARDPLAVVIAEPGRPGRRVLWVGESLLPSSVTRELWVDKPGRTESLLSALALAGPEGVDEEALFASVYGFTYNPALHRGAWDVALHRARVASSGVGSLTRRDGHVVLSVARSFVVADPRCQRGHEERVLQRMASAGGASARELAKELGLSLRTVQDVLRELVDTGACQQERDGRRRIYSVEDTTFQEPTRAGIEGGSES